MNWEANEVNAVPGVTAPAGATEQSVLASPRDAHGRVAPAIAGPQDVGETSHFVADLRRFRAALDMASDLVLLIDPTSLLYVDVNAAVCGALGYRREELLAMGPLDVFSASRDELTALYGRMIAGDLSDSAVEGWYRCKDGSRLEVETVRRAVPCEGGYVIVAVARDIGERKRSEQLRDLEHEVARCIAESAGLTAAAESVIRVMCESEGWECGDYWKFDAKTGLKHLQQSWGIDVASIRRFMDKSRGLALPAIDGPVGAAFASGRPIWIMDRSTDTGLVRATLAREAGMRSLFILPINAGGKVLGAFSFNSRSVREPDERFLQAARAIGDYVGEFLQRKQVEQDVRESEERFRSLTMLSSDSYWEQDDQYRFTSFTGTGRASIDAGHSGALGKRRWEREYVNLTPADWAAHIALYDARQPFRDFELCRIDSGRPLWISVSGEPAFDPSGAFKGYRGIGRDITARKLAEEELLCRNAELTALNARLSQAQEQLAQSEKLAAIGQLAAGVAHEINNPIGYVHSNLGSLDGYLADMFQVLEHYEQAEAALPQEHAAVVELRRAKRSVDLAFLKEDLPALMRESREGIDRVRKIVQDLKDFSRVDSNQELQWVSLHEGLDSTLNIVSNEIKYKADVIKCYGQIPDIQCRPSQLNQVFLNILVNAAHAIEGARGTITISSGQESDMVWVAVSDTGKGIPKESLPRIFDPFFTTKPVGQGTGLGLSLTYGIVQKHHGRIEVESAIGKGTTFRVLLPLRQPVAESEGDKVST